MTDIDVLWNIPAAVAGLAAGALFAVYLFLVHFRRPTPSHVTAGGIAFLIGVDSLVGAFLFTASQATAAIWTGDQMWVRIVSRGGLWAMFALGLSVTVYIALRHRGVR